MLENYRQPRWGVLYLTLPLAGLLFWLVQRGHAAGIVRSMLELGVLLIVFASVEVWRLANTVALLHHPLTGNAREPIYYAREVAGSQPSGRRREIQAVFVADSYSDLFSLPVQVGEPSPPSLELPSVERHE